jgi:hypothetical protein
VESIEATKTASRSRSRRRDSLSTPPVPALRCVTFPRTSSSVIALPLCNTGVMLPAPNKDGGLNPAAPSGAAPFCRISFTAAASKVPTGRKNRRTWPATMSPAAAGGV